MSRRTGSISAVYQRNMCISCGMCSVICPEDAIKMRYDSTSGLIAPSIGSSCTGCRRCLSVCYGLGVDSSVHTDLFSAARKSFVGSYIDAYAVKKPRHVTRNTRGGIITSVLASMIEASLIDAAIVVKFDPTHLPYTSAIIAHDIEKLQEASGSKYCPVTMDSALRFLDPNKAYAVVGLPCHLYGIRRLEQHNRTLSDVIRYHFGLLCGGMPSFLATEYLLNSYGLDNHAISTLEYRSGEWPGNLVVRGKVGSEEVAFQVTYPAYWHGTEKYFYPKRCLVCADGFNELSDLSFGDIWAPEMSEYHNLLVVRTERGKALLSKVMEMIPLETLRVNEDSLLRFQQGLLKMKSTSLIARMKILKPLLYGGLSVTTAEAREPTVKDILLGLELLLFRKLAGSRSLWAVFRKIMTIRRRVGQGR